MAEQVPSRSRSGVAMAEETEHVTRHTMNTGATKNIISSDVEIKGNLKFTGELTLEGKLEGEVSADGTLHLGESGVVTGNINATTVNLRGKVNGNVTAKEKVDIKAKAEVFGDIRAARLAIEEGVTIVGRTEVNPNKVTPTPPPQVQRPGEAPRTVEAGKPPGR
jgi:cytoskeletal protein CcmA (bactofilin family)